MPNNRLSNVMRKLFITCLFSLAMLAAPVNADGPEPVAANAQGQHLSALTLQARFAKLQQIARPDDLAFDLQLVEDGHALLGHRGDGIIRLPQNWALAAPDVETLDFLMLLGLANATMREPERQGPSMATKIVTGTLGWIAENVLDDTAIQKLPAPHFESGKRSSEPTPALRALTWATAAGGCEARVIAGLEKLGDIKGSIGSESRGILKALGAVAWTPNDRCSPALR